MIGARDVLEPATPFGRLGIGVGRLVFGVLTTAGPVLIVILTPALTASLSGTCGPRVRKARTAREMNTHFTTDRAEVLGAAPTGKAPSV